MFCIMMYTYYYKKIAIYCTMSGRFKVCMFCAKIAVDCSHWASVFCIRLIFVRKNNTKFSPTMHEKKYSPRLSTDKWVYYYCDFMLICYRSHYILIPHMAKFMSEWDLNYVNPFQLFDSTGLHWVYSVLNTHQI